MPKPLTALNAEITTAQVEIRALTVAGKQVTLAVFRQLRETPLVMRDATLAGVPWGIVNYHPDKCSESPMHVHVVWQRGSELLRSRVLVGPDPDGAMLREAAAMVEGQILAAALRRGSLDHDIAKQIPSISINLRYRTKEPVVVLDEGYTFKVEAMIHESAVTVADHIARGDQPSLEDVNHLRTYLDSKVPGASVTSLEAAYEEAIIAELRRRSSVMDTRHSLLDLPQLFIAV